MEICASSVCWWNDDRVSMFRKAAAAGFKNVEVLMFPKAEICDVHGDIRMVNPAQIKKELADANLNLAGLHLGAIMTSTETLRRAMTDYCRRALDFAVELGCPIIVESGPDRTTEPVEPYMESLEELAPLFEKTPVKLALENHYGNWLQYIADYDRVFSRIDSPGVGMTLDTGHFTSANVDPAEVARTFAGRIFHVHVKDHIGTESVALGEGITDNFAVVRELKAAGYDGYLSQEIELEDGSKADHAAHVGYDYMSGLLNP